jgi:hypothetical protein
MQATTKITEKYYANVYNVNHGVKLDKGRGCLTSNLLVAISKSKHGEKFWDENFCLEVQAVVGRELQIVKDYMNFMLTPEEKLSLFKV